MASAVGEVVCGKMVSALALAARRGGGNNVHFSNDDALGGVHTLESARKVSSSHPGQDDMASTHLQVHTFP